MKVLAVSLITACAALAGCATREPPPGVAEVPECRQAAQAVTQSEFETPLRSEQRRADVYATCMEARGYALAADRLDKTLLREEQVRNSDRMGGDPYPYLVLRRQQLRASPTMWEPASAPAQ